MSSQCEKLALLIMAALLNLARLNSVIRKNTQYCCILNKVMILSWKRGNLTMLKLDRKKIIATIQDEISNFPKARYYHRLHVALYALKTGSCYKAASVYGHSPHSIYNWLHRIEANGLLGLQKSARQGRSPRLAIQETILHADLSRPPKEFGYNQSAWTGQLLSHHLKNTHLISLGTRQCQNILKRFRSNSQNSKRKEIS